MKAWAYKDFEIEELFITLPCSKKIKKKDGISGGTVPIFSSDTTNNGIVGYCSLEPHWKVSIDIPRYLVFGDHTRTFNIAECDFCVADNVKVLIPKIKLCSRDLLYIITVWKKAIPNLGYSRHWSVAKKVKLNLPITSTGEIDFTYMQARIQEMEQARIQEMDTYLKVAGFEDCELTEEETSALRKMRNGLVGFKAFYVTDDKASHRTNGIFHVNNSHNILQSSILAGSGSIPYVTAGESNNSVSAYISYDRDLIEKGNSIMIGGKTMVITYQAEDFFSNDSHNLVLYAKDDNLRNELIQLFLVASLSKSLKPIYSWGDSISKAKIKKDKLRLPVTISGEIDNHFMETYIRAQEKLAIQRVKDWREKEITATKNVVNLTPTK